MKLFGINGMIVSLWLVMATSAPAALEIKVASPNKATGKRTAIELDLKNTFTNKIESVRAVVVLLDENGKMVGQQARWIIGGTKEKPGLAPGARTNYSFVVPTDKPFTKTKVMINRLILEDGKPADPVKDVQIQQAQ